MYKVLFLGWEYYPAFTGGLGVVCHAMAEEMAEQDLEIYVVLPSLPKQIPLSKVNFPQKQQVTERLRYKHQNITVHYTSLGMEPYANTEDERMAAQYGWQLDKRKKKGSTSGGLYGSDLLAKIHEYKELVSDLVVDLEFDVIHAHDWMTFLAAVEAKEASGKKCVLQIHSTEFDRSADNPNEIVLNIEKAMLNQANLIIAVSEHTKNTLAQKYGLPDDKIRVVHNALATQHCYDVDQKIHLGPGKTVMFLGRVVVQKGVETFVQVARKVLDHLPDTNFIVAGTGSSLHRMIEMVAEQGMASNFIFTGFVNRWEGDILYKNADLFLMTSGSEPFGITALEAINQGTPVLVTKTSGVAEVLPNAIAIDYWDTDKFADYTINILRDDTLKSLLGAQQRSDFDKLTWKSQVEKITEVYTELLAVEGEKYKI